MGNVVSSLLLVAMLQGTARAESPPPVAVEASRWPVSPPRIGGYLLVAGGVVVTTAGGLLAYSGASQASEANVRLAAAKTPAAWDRSKADFDAGKSRNEKGWVVAGLGAAAVVAGGVLVFLYPEPERRPADTTVAPWLTGDAGGLLLTRAF
jgi:hypothetical protein